MLRGGASLTQSPSSELRLGLDLGSVNVKLVVLNASGQCIASAVAPTRGDPLAAVAALLDQHAKVLDSTKELSVAITGVSHRLLTDSTREGAEELRGAAPEHINEVLATAAGARLLAPTARTVVDLGGQFSKWIELGPAEADGSKQPRVVDFATNGLCAAGSGAFLEQQAGRLGLSVEELGDHAMDALRSPPIAGRCSVFAKSDMIHLQQKGTPVGELARGLCDALARTFSSTVLQGRAVAQPLLLVGGGACSPGLHRAFGQALLGKAYVDRPAASSAEELHAPQSSPDRGPPPAALKPKQGEALLPTPGDPRLAGALGAASLAGAASLTYGQLSQQVERCRAALQKQPQSISANGDQLAPLGQFYVDQPLRQERPPTAGGVRRAYLGVDVGSVSTNLVLWDAAVGSKKGEDGLIRGVYLPTRGRPVEAIDAGLDQLYADLNEEIEIAGVGTTGSGRYLAKELLGGDIVRNEITAQLTSTTHFFPEADTIFEIGGQDSKFISIRNGMLGDFEMNKICAAGTGSFLEEQAARLDVKIIDEFAARAREGQAPCDLGTRCTVFMDTELVRAQQAGASVEDLCAGLAYSVARNYLEKLVAGKRVGKQIIFQGGTASNSAVVGAFRTLLGRPVAVHPYNRISGAIGVALLAAEAQTHSPYKSSYVGREACREVGVSSFECRHCENRCQVNRVAVDAKRAVHFGDICERFSEKDRLKNGTTGPQAAAEPAPFEELFAARHRIFEEHIAASMPAEGEEGRPTIGLLRASFNLEMMPFWAAFLRHLGYRPVIADATTPRMLKESAGGVPAEVCLPIKAAAAQCHTLLEREDVDQVFAPALLELPPRAGDRETFACFYNQQLPDMLKSLHGPRLITAQFTMQDGVFGLAGSTLALASALHRKKTEVLEALVSARKVQQRFNQRRKAIGELALAQHFDRAVVVLGKPYNAHDPCLNLSLGKLLEKVGLRAIPWDLLDLDDVELSSDWDTVPWHFNRDQLRALEVARRDGRLYPLLISSYGCGPDGFMVKHLDELLVGVPRLLLEFDEHRGDAGLVTRLEAFSDEIDAHIRNGGGERRSALKPTTAPRAPLPQGRRCFIPDFAPHAPLFAAMLRTKGYEAEVLPPADHETVRLGEKQSSGRECHPYNAMVGDLLKLEQRGVREGDVFFMVSMQSPCLLRQYGDSMRLLTNRIESPIEVWDGAARELQRLVGVRGLLELQEGLFFVDTVFNLARRLRPYLRDPSAADAVLHSAIARAATTIEKGESATAPFEESIKELMALRRDGEPGDLPVVGVTGDFYTRVSDVGNSGLFARLEALGCEVWPNSGFASMSVLGRMADAPRFAEKGRIRSLVDEGLIWALDTNLRYRMTKNLDPVVRALAVEPDANELAELARPYLGLRSNHMITAGVAKTVDFLRGGAAGVLNVAGINCMVGVTIDAAIAGVRADFNQAPVLTLLYGGGEGPAQEIRLETFVHQAKQHAETIVRRPQRYTA